MFAPPIIDVGYATVKQQKFGVYSLFSTTARNDRIGCEMLLVLQAEKRNHFSPVSADVVMLFLACVAGGQAVENRA